MESHQERLLKTLHMYCASECLWNSRRSSSFRAFVEACFLFCFFFSCFSLQLWARTDLKSLFYLYGHCLNVKTIVKSSIPAFWEGLPNLLVPALPAAAKSHPLAPPHSDILYNPRWQHNALTSAHCPAMQVHPPTCPQPTQAAPKAPCELLSWNCDEAAERAASLQQQQIRPTCHGEEQSAGRHLICADRTGSCHFCTPLWSAPLVTLVPQFRILCSINIKLPHKRWVTDLLNILNWNYIEYSAMPVCRLLLSSHFSTELRSCNLRYMAFYWLRQGSWYKILQLCSKTLLKDRHR